MAGSRRVASSLAVVLLSTLTPAGCGEGRGADPPDVVLDAGDTGGVLLPVICPDVIASFRDCGGSPLGAWRTVGSCPILPADDALRRTCPVAEVVSTVTVDVLLDLRTDATWVMRTAWQGGVVRTTFPLACFGGSPRSCTADAFGGSCAHDDTTCSCARSSPQETVDGQGRFGLETGRLQLEQGGAIRLVPFCIDATERMTIRLEREGTDEVHLVVLERDGPAR